MKRIVKFIALALVLALVLQCSITAAAGEVVPAVETVTQETDGSGDAAAVEEEVLGQEVAFGGSEDTDGFCKVKVGTFSWPLIFSW